MSVGAAASPVRPVVRQSIWRRMLHNPLTILGMGIMTVIVLLTLFGPLIVPNDPLTVQMSERLQSPSWQYPLGTDHMGRCIFSRLAAGAQTTLGISALAIVSVTLIGIPLGLLSGYIGGRLDSLLMRLVDSVGALPEFILAIAFSGFLGPSVTNLMLSIVLVKWIGYARVVRSIVLSEREKEYILAARVAGCRTWTILWRHLLPQIVPPVLVLVALDIGKVILIISSLSYLGLGVQLPSAEWGAMLNDGRPYFQTVPELMIYPGLAIILVVVSCNLIGDGLRDILDVRSR
ncbi:ABC transporter permease subunit [Brevibacillus humidisoli]|uniref:nickel transporter permease n=1 Tax=Brevibacillus humidisoli TaxID=2895522 RepID=UPI001E65DBB1|nr:nickel transporter permease [Brevibacillus humidisoli]UFJ41833.1 ABC transporter permease subunit [Brevibacillus humidisoli]